VGVKPGPKFEAGAPKTLFATNVAPNAWFDVSADGRFLIPAQQESGGAPITVILNWPAMLKKQALAPQ
jgi:hypothetical protein